MGIFSKLFNRPVKISFQKTGERGTYQKSADYTYTVYYKNGTTKEYKVFTEYGIKWYYQDDATRVSMSFEDKLERLHRLMAHRDTNYLEETV